MATRTGLVPSAEPEAAEPVRRLAPLLLSVQTEQNVNRSVPVVFLFLGGMFLFICTF